jgi:hypothetical protein
MCETNIKTHMKKEKRCKIGRSVIKIWSGNMSMDVNYDIEEEDEEEEEEEDYFQHVLSPVALRMRCASSVAALVRSPKPHCIPHVACCGYPGNKQPV